MTPLSSQPTRTARRVAVWAAGVVVLVAVIFGLSALTGGSGRGDKDSAYLPTSSQLGQKAEIALRSGDDTSALSLAMQALAMDSDNAAAQDVAQAVASRRGETSGGATDGPAGQDASGGDSPAAADAFTGKLANPVALMPTSFTGYSLGQAVGMGGEFSLSGTANKADAGALNIIWAIHETGSPKEASAFVSKTSKTLYAKDVGTSDIDGADAYVATDGTRYACSVYTRGRYVFEVLVSGTDEQPSAYRSVAISAAKAFADSAPQ